MSTRGSYFWGNDGSNMWFVQVTDMKREDFNNSMPTRNTCSSSAESSSILNSSSEESNSLVPKSEKGRA